VSEVGLVGLDTQVTDDGGLGMSGSPIKRLEAKTKVIQETMGLVRENTGAIQEKIEAIQENMEENQEVMEPKPGEIKAYQEWLEATTEANNRGQGTWDVW
jgi:peptidoglycan hydrolase CwlO-like protein